MGLTFGIAVATYRRPDGSTPGYVERAIASVLSQLHPQWVLYLIGDRYDREEEFNMIASGVPQSKLRLLNLPVALERDANLTRRQLWRCGGTNAMNTAIKMQREDLIDVTCHLDDDDVWLPHHLQSLDMAYRNYAEASFVYTRAKYLNRRLPRRHVRMYYDNLPPAPGRLVHSSASWKLSQIPLDYQSSTKAPSDAIMWNRISKYCREQELRTLFVPELTVIKDSEKRLFTFYP